MEPIAITVRFDEQGNPTPLKFTWLGSTYAVESAGRRWEDEDGQHVLVMVPGGEVYELLFATNEGRWYLKTTGRSRTVV